MYLKWSVIAFGLNILVLLLRLQAHKIYERIHDINMTNLNAETIGQVNVAKNCITVLMMLNLLVLVLLCRSILSFLFSSGRHTSLTQFLIDWLMSIWIENEYSTEWCNCAIALENGNVDEHKHLYDIICRSIPFWID